MRSRQQGQQPQSPRDAWSEFWVETVDVVRTERQLSTAERVDRQTAVARGENAGDAGLSQWVHLGLCFVTGGLWLPVFIYVIIRDERKNNRSLVVRNDKARRKQAKQMLASREAARARGEDLPPLPHIAALDAPTVRLRRPGA